jgi:hypothetical protein
VQDQVRAPLAGQPDDRIGELVVERAEEQTRAPGARGSRQLGAGDQRMAEEDPQRDPAEGEARRDVVYGQAGVGGGQATPARGQQHVVTGVAQRDRQRHQWEGVPDQRGGDHQHTHGNDPMSTAVAPMSRSPVGTTVWPAGGGHRAGRTPAPASPPRPASPRWARSGEAARTPPSRPYADPSARGRHRR